MVIFEHQPLCTDAEIDLTIQRLIAWAPDFICFLFTLGVAIWT
jgi:hypothetical protein